MVGRHRQSEWTQGWSTVLAGFMGMSLLSAYGIMLSLLIKPMNDSLGWARAEVSLGFLIVMIEQILLVPYCASLIPRLGPRRIIIVGIIIYLSGIALVALAPATLLNWYLGWAILGIGAVAISPLVWTTVIARTFTRHRGLAFSLALSGSGLTAMLVPIGGAYMLEAFGWRGPFYMLGLVGLCIMMPILLWLMNVHGAFDRHSSRDGSQADSQHPERWSFALLKEPGVWLLMLAGLLIAACVGTLMTHTLAILRDGGASVTQAAYYYSASGPSLIIGRIVAGILLDRFSTRLVSMVLFLLPALSCVLILNFDGSAWIGITACVFLGLGLGAESDVLAYLTAKHFGTRRYPFVYSLAFGSFILGHGLAVVAAGWVFDMLDSYQLVLYGLIVSVLCAIFAIDRLERRVIRTA